MKTLIEKLEKMQEIGSGEVCRVDTVIEEVIDIVKEHSDWVACSELLPSNSGEYLVYCIGNTEFAKDRKVRSVMLFNAKGNIWAGLSPIFKVTHWQPLLQSPSEVQSELEN